MTTGMLIVNIVLIAVVAAIVAVPAVLIPNLLDRDVRAQTAKPAAGRRRHRHRAPLGPRGPASRRRRLTAAIH